jgi:hypothetical protein
MAKERRRGSTCFLVTGLASVRPIHCEGSFGQLHRNEAMSKYHRLPFLSARRLGKIRFCSPAFSSVAYIAVLLCLFVVDYDEPETDIVIFPESRASLSSTVSLQVLLVKETDNDFFNPSIQLVPSDWGFTYAAVWRARHESGFLQGEVSGVNHSITRTYLKGCLLDVEFRCTGPPEVVNFSALAKDASLAIDRRYLEDRDSHFRQEYDKYLGAEDPRLVWCARTKQVLLLFNFNSLRPEFVRSIYIVDYKSVFSPLAKALKQRFAKAYLASSNVFLDWKEMHFKKDSRVEKNWVPMIRDEELLISYSIFPRAVVRPSASGECMFQVAQPLKPKQVDLMWLDSNRFAINQGSAYMPYYHCKPDACNENTTRHDVSIFHIRARYRPTLDSYFNFVHITDISPPFRSSLVRDMRNIESFIREKLTRPHAFIYVSSISLSATSARELNPTRPRFTPNLGSEVILSIGIDNVEGYALRIPLGLLIGRF